MRFSATVGAETGAWILLKEHTVVGDDGSGSGEARDTSRGGQAGRETADLEMPDLSSMMKNGESNHGPHLGVTPREKETGEELFWFPKQMPDAPAMREGSDPANSHLPWSRTRKRCSDTAEPPPMVPSPVASSRPDNGTIPRFPRGTVLPIRAAQALSAALEFDGEMAHAH